MGNYLAVVHIVILNVALADQFAELIVSGLTARLNISKM